MTDATTGDQVDNKVGELEQAICDIHGIPIDTPVANAGFLWDATGLKKVLFSDNAADPNAAGQLVRNGSVLKYYSGTSAKTVACSVVSSVSESAATNTAAETALYGVTLEAGMLGTAGFIHGHVELLVTTMLNGSNLQLLFYLAGGQFFVPAVFNNSGGTVTFSIGTDFLFHGRNSATAQIFSITSVLGIENSLVNFGPAGLFSIHRGGLININAAVDQAFQVNAIWSVASPSNSVSAIGLDIFRSV